MKYKPKYNPNILHRRSIRLKGYDYSQNGLYFITICCHAKACLFGEVINGKMILNNAGKLSDKCWMEIPIHFPNVVLHEYVIMPNHVHAIIESTNVMNLGVENDVAGVQNFEPLQDNMENAIDIGKIQSTTKQASQLL